MEFLKDFFMLVGRVCISSMFLWAAFDKMKNWNATVAHLRAKHVPKIDLLLPVSLALKILGGLSIFFGWYAHLGAFLLLIVALPSVVFFHSFWNAPENEKMLQKKIFMKEIAVIGGLFLILAGGSGPWGFGGS
jgi:putative oxidoreductase